MANSENSTAGGKQNQFLVSRFQYLIWKQFNGNVIVESDKGLKWSLFFCQGRLIWATGGSHPIRLWRRHLMRHCPDMTPSAQAWQYHALSLLLKRDQITETQFVAVISGTVGEVLFDIIQQASLEQLSYTSKEHNEAIECPLNLIDTEQAFKQAIHAWELWREAGLAKISPNLAPVLRQPEQLQQQASATVYQNLVTLINGSSTLRDLAMQMKQDLLLLTKSLTPYIRKGIIGLVQVSDLSPPLSKQPSNTHATPTSSQTTPAKSPLIACVDDSPQTCQIMEKIFHQAGYRFISIQNSVEALPMLLQRKPDLIFLDLVMPVVNGYELCAQLRRVALFAKTPMIILTGNDGLIDRVRAKVVGASDFLGKPVEAEKVLAVVQKYLSAPSLAVRKSNLDLSEPTLGSP